MAVGKLTPLLGHPPGWILARARGAASVCQPPWASHCHAEGRRRVLACRGSADLASSTTAGAPPPPL
eukprot:7644604-Lingulodinium_polyedra.AAC.1